MPYGQATALFLDSTLLFQVADAFERATAFRAHRPSLMAAVAMACARHYQLGHGSCCAPGTAERPG